MVNSASDIATPTGRTSLLRFWAASPGRGVIFDFNGTLSNDEPILLRVFTELFAEQLDWTLTPDDYYTWLAGHSDREIIEMVVADAGVADRPVAGVDGSAAGAEPLVDLLLRRRRRRYRELVEDSSPITPAAAALVRRLSQAGVPLAIVTGAQRPDVEFVLERSTIAGLIPVVVTEEDVTRGKPDPEGFLAGAAGLGLHPGDLLAFEDSPAGIRAAKAAGMLCVAVEGTRGAHALAEADFVVTDLNPGLMDGVLPD
jgi:beta-phosphoglucomutase